jgi:plastocyanin
MRAALMAALLGFLGAAQAADFRAVVRNEGGQPLAEAVVIAAPETARPPLKPRLEEVEQISQEFVPRVKAILVGSSVSFPNRDEVRHHVYSFSPTRRFDLPLYTGTPPQPVLFDKPGVVTIGCNIHDWMVGYIYVSESPYYATTGADGTALLAALPAGRYTVRVWHPQLGAREEATQRRIELGAAGETSQEWRIELKPEVRVRRAPAPGQGRRY